MDKVEDLTPKRIVEELDRYIIGQNEAKRSVAIALRNRWRRMRLPDKLKDEVAPKNIIMMGPTGVGKTEIARRLARLTSSPFTKVEASKFTEVGYVGRDVESMIRDLTDLAVNMVRQEIMSRNMGRARELAEEKLLDILLPPAPKVPEAQTEEAGASARDTREKLRSMLDQGLLDDRVVEIEVSDRSKPTIEVFSSAGMEEMDLNIKDFLGNIFPQKTKNRKMPVSEALEYLTQEEASRLADMDEVVRIARERVEHSGIIFIDEIDKIAHRESHAGPDVSREGVQRDLLPIVEGSSVNTKYGMVRTDHILFIASGAFHVAKPSDLIPEMQGRFPIRVELDSLTKDDFTRILVEPDNALIKQYTALLKTEDVDLTFDSEAVDEIAGVAALINERMENIGARRLHTVMEKLLEEISFEAPDLSGKELKIDRAYVKMRLEKVVESEDLSRYIL